MRYLTKIHFQSHESKKQSSENLPRYLFFKCLVLLILIAITLLINLNIHAAEAFIRLNRITIEDGLSQSTVSCILQDSKGFMWFGTEDGLNKYDGYRFVIYKSDQRDSTSLSDSYTLSIYEDRDAVLWVGTYNGGLNRFDREKEQFTHYKHNPHNPDSISHNCINSIYEDKAGILWIGTDHGLNRFDREKGKFTHYKHDPNNPDSLSHDSVNSIYEDKDGVLWIGTNSGGLNKFDREKGEFIHHKHDPNNPDSLSHDSVNSIYEDKDGALWIGTNSGGLDKFDRENGKFIHYRHVPDDPHSLSNDSVRSIYEDKAGELWIGTFGGLNKFDPEEEIFTHYKHDSNDPYSLSSTHIISIYEDRSSVLWFGTYGGGVNRYNQGTAQFVHWSHAPASSQSLSNNIVLSIYEDRAGVLWIGTYGEGLNRFDREKEEWTHYRHDPYDPNSLSHNYVRSIYEDKSGMLWIGTYDGGLNRFDREKGEWTHYRNDSNDPHSLSHDYVRSIYEDKDGVLWIATFGGLNKFDREKEEFTRYRHDPNNPHSLSNDRVTSVYEDRNGVLWVGTGGGLNKFDREKEEFTYYRHDTEDPYSLSNDRVLSIWEDKAGILCLGTYGGGLNRFDPERERFLHYREKNGLPNDVIYGVLEDDNGNLWVSTNNGLSKFNPRNGTFRNYDVNDGLQSNEFNSGAYHKNRSGEMFFGGINGFNSFHPNNIRDNLYTPPVVVTDFQIYNRSIPVGEGPEGKTYLIKSITETDEIKLSYKDRVLSFQFAALHYASPEKNEFAYKMEGFEEDWNFVANRHFATYTNLPPGNYVFRVKGSNNDGIWNEEGVSLKITITPPFWKTWWFQVLGLSSIISLFVSVFQVRTRSIRKRARELENRVRKRTSELKSANKELQQEIIVRKQAEEALQTEKAYLDQLFDSAQEAIVSADNDHRVLRINSEFTRLFGYSPQEAVGQNIDELVASEELTEEASSYSKQLTEGKGIAFESRRKRKDGTLIHVSGIGSPIIIEGEKKGYYAIYRDITERKRAEEDIKRRATQTSIIYKVGQRVSSKLELQSLLSEIVIAIQEAFNYYNAMMLLIDKEGKRLIMQAISGGYDDIFPKDLSIEIGKGMIGYAAETGETQLSVDVSQDPHYVCTPEEISNSELAVPIKSEDRIIGVLDIQCDKFDAFDETDVEAMETLSTQIAAAIENARLYEEAQKEIAERKKVEAQLSDSLKEKEVLLKEIHHRVKNNMQIISSLLRLQSWHIKNKKTQEALNISQNRIRSMALIHEKLYQSKDLAKIDFSDYIRSLMSHLLNAYREGNESVRLKIDAGSVFLDVNSAIPLGLIINELVSNSLKYAFPKENADEERTEFMPEVHLLLRSDNGRVTLGIRDNGVGLPKDFDFSKSKSLGLKLVHDLVDQLEGSIKQEKKKGTAFKITFEAPK